MCSSDQVSFLLEYIAHHRSTAVFSNQTVFVTLEIHHDLVVWKKTDKPRIFRISLKGHFGHFPPKFNLNSCDDSLWFSHIWPRRAQHSLTKATTASRTVPETRVTWKWKTVEMSKVCNGLYYTYWLNIRSSPNVSWCFFQEMKTEKIYTVQKIGSLVLFCPWVCICKFANLPREYFFG